jgi:hypothetical protein
MRHVGTLIAAIVIGPLAWIMLALGQERSDRAFAGVQASSVAHPHDFIRPLLLLAGAGILLGIVATLRFSPLGAVLIGVVYAASYVALLIDPKWLLDRLDRNISIAGRHAHLVTPIRTGTTLLLGALLLVAVASVSRWRRWPTPPAEEPEALPSLNRSKSDGLGLFSDRDPTTEYVSDLKQAVAGGSRWSGFVSDPGDARR